MTADRVRVDHRSGRVQVRDLVCVVRNWRDSKDSSGIFPRILRLERLAKKQKREDLGSGQAHGVHHLLFLKGPLGLQRQENVGKYLLLLSDFLKDDEKANDLEPPIPLKRAKQTLPSLLRQPCLTVDWTALTVDMC